MATLFVRHKVTDFAKWKKVYDDLGPTQKRMGVTAEAIYRAADNPDDVTVTHDFASIEAAQAFAASNELRTAMQSAGIAGAPTIWFGNRA
jgi:hypothetical protein